jgi:ketosteroid isomerase-like protein
MIETQTAAEATVLRGYQAFATADMEALGELFHPDIVWTHHNDDRFGGPKAGWPAVAQYFAESAELTAGNLEARVESTTASGDLVAVAARMIGTRPDGRRFDDPQMHLFRLRDGRVVQVDQYVGDPKAVEEFWA